MMFKSDYFDTQINIDAFNTILYLDGSHPLQLAK